MSRIIIGLTGETGAGKDTLARYMAMAYGFDVIAFADQNRKEVADAWGFDVAWFDSYPFKDTPFEWLTIANCKDKQFIGWFNAQAAAFYNYQSNTPRQLQLLWSDYMKFMSGDDWYRNVVDHKLRDFSHRNFIVTDIRSNAEAELIIKQPTYDLTTGGIFKVVNSNPRIVKPKDARHTEIKHALHTPIDTKYIRACISNDGSLYEFALHAENLFRGFIPKTRTFIRE